MTPLSPQVLTLMQDLSSWILAGRCADAAAALGRWSEIQPAFAPWAAGASAIAGLPTGIEFQKKGLLRLLTSSELVPVLCSPSPSEISALTQALRIEGTWGLKSPEQALIETAGGLSRWDALPLRAVLSGVVEAGGIGDLALAVEKVQGGIAGRDHGRARERLHELTNRFLRFYVSALDESLAQRDRVSRLLLSSPAVSGAARVYLRSEEAEERLRDLTLLLGCRTFLEEQISALAPENTGPLLTDLLQPDDRRLPVGRGRWLPSSLLAAHVLTAAGVALDSLIHNCPHVSLSLPGTPLAFETTRPSAALRTLEEWRDVGLLGQGQTPGALSDLLSGTLNAASVVRALKEKNPSRLREGYEAALRITPDHFTTLVNRAHLDRDDAPRLRFIAERIARLDPQSPWPSFFEAYALRAEKKRRAALYAFEEVFRKCVRSGMKYLEEEVVPLLPDEHLELALNDYLDLCREEKSVARADTLLADMREHPSARIREHVRMLWFLLHHPGGAKA